MRYNDGVAIVDDIPLLSQWIKKSTSRNLSIFWLGNRDFPRSSLRYRLVNARCPRWRKQYTVLFLFTTDPLGFESFCILHKIKMSPTIRPAHFNWRRWRDSNPRRRFNVLHDFQSCALDQLRDISV